MKIPKLLVVATMMAAMAVPAMGATSSLVMTFSIAEDYTLCTGTVHYEIILTNQDIGGANPVVVDVLFYPPGPTGAAGAFGPPVLIADDLALAVGASIKYNHDGSSGGVAKPALEVDLSAIPLDCAATVAYAEAAFDGQYTPPPPAAPYTAQDSRDIPVTVLGPAITLDKYADREVFCEGDDPLVTYTFDLYNSGTEDIWDPYVWDSECGLIADETGDYTGDNGDGYLNPGETWTVTCQQTLTGTTTNYGGADGFGRYTGAYVTADDEWTVTASPPPVVSVNPQSAEMCELADGVEFCAEIDEDFPGTPPYSYSWTKTGDPTVIGTDACIIVSEAGEYCVTVTDDAGCEDTACGTLTVIPQPDCSINSGPRSICEDGIGIPIEYCSDDVADNYWWVVISGPADPILPLDNGLPCVEITPTGLGTIVLELQLWNDVAPDGSCGNSCQIEIVVEECGGGYCTFTQGFYGNEGGKSCGGLTTTEIINAVIGDGVVVGIEGERSIKLLTAACIITRLPAGGTPMALPAFGDQTDNCDAASSTALDAVLTKAKGKDKTQSYNNVLIGQVVALTLNLRLHTIPCMDADGFDQALGDYVFNADAEYICVQEGEDGCIERYMVPEALRGLSANDILLAANMALAGDELDIGAINDAATFINELFDECRTIVTCPVDPVEICDDGCDNDFDDLVDCDDPDCELDPACD